MDQEQLLKFLKLNEGHFFSVEDLALNLKSQNYTIQNILSRIINNDINNGKYIVKKYSLTDRGATKFEYSFVTDDDVIQGLNEINYYRKKYNDYKSNNDIILLLILAELRKINTNISLKQLEKDLEAKKK